MATSAQTKMTIIVGTNGTGKSTVSRSILSNLKVPRKLVLTRQLDEWNCPVNQLTSQSDFSFKGLNQHIVTNVSETLEKLHYIRNAAVLFDDARKFLPAKTDDELNALYISRRQYGMHLFFVAHSFDQVPIQAFGFATHLILFKTMKPIGNSRLDQLNDPDKILEAKRRIDEAAKKNHYHYEVIEL